MTSWIKTSTQKLNRGWEQQVIHKLNIVESDHEREALRDYAVFYHKEIVGILDEIKRELLLILKTNNYLRAIDKRIGNPTNTFNIIAL